ncbi:MAG: hypothetical protein J0L64_06485 [Acidobacteria bacterium]|nr:hypothetical protein [Acidobacteriota bacterium]
MNEARRASNLSVAREFRDSSQGRIGAWRRVFRGHGLNIAVQSNDRTVLDALALDTVPGLVPADGESPDLKYTVQVSCSGGWPRCDVYLGTRKIAEGMEVLQTPGFVQSHVESTVASAAPTEVFVHAGAVAWNGRLILLPGRSYSGKTTLVREFLSRGATYYSDEFAVVDFSGRIHAYPRPLNLRSGDWLTDPERAAGGEVASSRAGHRAMESGCACDKRVWKMGVHPVRPDLVVFASYQPAGRWRAERLTPGCTALELMANTVAARSRTKFALHCLKEIAQRVTAYRTVRGEAVTAADHVLSLLAGVHDSKPNN